VALWSKHEVCAKCRKKDDAKTPHLGSRHGKPIVRTGKFCRCKMRNCGKRFELQPWQDERYTWYCPDCRRQVAVITTGVLWLGNSFGIELLPEDEIVMGSVADAYEEDQHETLLLQSRDGQVGHPPANVQDDAEPGRPAPEKGKAGEVDRPQDQKDLQGHHPA
jgi:hypothetical protein